MILPLLAEIPFPGIDPVAFHLGPLTLRWYGLAYLVGFVIAGMVFDRLVRDGFLALDRPAISDLVGWLVVGVIVGGRLGYALIYDRSLFAEPARLAQVWRGGLSFHGGLAACILLTLWFARRRKIQWRRLADAMVLAAPFGIFLVRCTNFINAELYGRLAPAWLPWAMRFPTDPVAKLQSPEMARAAANWFPAYEQLKENGTWSLIEQAIPLRHPSQLYEAFAEGALVAAVLWIVYRKFGARLKPGRIGVLFLVLYAVLRFLVEFTRQPDRQLGFVAGPFSMGQLLSVAVLGAAALMYWWPARDSNVRSAENATSVL